MTEFLPHGYEALFGRQRLAIERELERRILQKYPLQRQIFILISILATRGAVAGVRSEDYIIARDGEEASRYIKFVTLHRHAAKLLTETLRKDPDSIARTDVTASKWWPGENDHVKT